MIRAAAIAAWALSGLAAGAETAAPYAGLDGRDVATLPPERVAGLRAGAGLGYALAAELNGYPGPLHVLEHGAALDLTPQQRAAVEAIRARMLARARPLGEALIAAEAALDAAFEAGGLDPARLSALTVEAGTTEAALRAVHLEAHLETAPLLNRHQRMVYARLRGYDEGGHGGGHGGH
ncbi:hypothetical protein [Jannaschia sp. LMIT008]|uniref:hypothetical protein n=1 Tax=Jannaschia maritima TaxID=3032585 RepID=UPI002811C737|nr:hypothetical protein [Jannaschia sp. LMIT008]